MASQPSVAAIDVLQMMADSVICTDPSGSILLFNQAAEKSFGYSAAEVLGESVNVLLPQGHRAEHAKQVTAFGLSAGSASRLMGDKRKVAGRRKNGKEFAAEASISRHTIDGRTILTVVLRDITERRKLEEYRKMMARELDHRIKNIFSVVSALVALTAKSSSSVTELRKSLQDRLNCLAATQNLLTRSKETNIEFRDLLDSELKAYRSSSGTNVNITGSCLVLRSSAIQPLALVIHELATNSAKYGAFSEPNGCVNIAISASDTAESRQFSVDWRETGGPPARPPELQGFGTHLIEQMIKLVFRGDVVFDYRPQGMICRIVIPAAELEN